MSSRHWTLALFGALVLTVVCGWAAVVKLADYAQHVQVALKASSDAQRPTADQLAGDLFKGLAMAAGFVLSAIFAVSLMLRRGFAFRHPTTYLFLLAGVVVLIHQIGVRDWLFVSLGAGMVIYGVGDLVICLKNHVHSSGKVSVDQVAGI